MEENKIKSANKLGQSMKIFILNSVVLLVFWFIADGGFVSFFVHPLFIEIQNEIPEWGVPVSELQLRLDLYTLISDNIGYSMYFFMGIPSISYVISLKKQKENFKKPYFSYFMISELIFAFILFIISILHYINLYLEIYSSEIYFVCQIFLILGKVGSSIFLFLALKDEFFESFREDIRRKLKKYMIIMIVGSFYTWFYFSLMVMILSITFLIGTLLVSNELKKIDHLMILNQPTNSSQTSL